MIAGKALCGCLECRIRAALYGHPGGPTENFEIDTGEAIRALGNVMGEMLAHYPTPVIKDSARALIECARKWKMHPRVAVQHPVGSA